MPAIELAARTRILLELGADDTPPAGPAPAVPEAVREAAIAALRRGETHYTDRPGIAPLRSSVSAWLEAHCGISSDPASDVLITCGVTEARFVAVQQLVEPGAKLFCLGDRAAVAGAAAVRGAGLLEGDPEPTPEALAAVSALYLPLQAAATETGRRWLREAAERDWWLICEFDIEPGLGSVDHPGASGALAERTVTIGAIGRSAGLDGWRVGYLLAPSTNAPQLRSFKQALTICTTNLSQWGALALLKANP